MRSVRWLAVTMAVATTSPAVAQYNSPQNIKFISAKPYGSYTKFGTFVGPYWLQLLGEPGQPTKDAFCVDFDNFVSTAQTGWQANLTNLGSGDLSGTRQAILNGGDVLLAQRNYEAAAWLASTMMADADKANWWKYSGAIWYLTSGADPMTADNAGLTSGDRFYNPFYALNASEENMVRQWAANALNNYGDGSFNADNWVVITPTAAYTSQEFITNVVPEPASLILLGSGLLTLGAFAYFRRGAA